MTTTPWNQSNRFPANLEELPKIKELIELYQLQEDATLHYDILHFRCPSDLTSHLRCPHPSLPEDLHGIIAMQLKLFDLSRIGL